jgi:phage tail-like protein
MDANGLRFWLLADERDYRLEGSPPPVYDRSRRSLRLESFRQSALIEAVAAAEARLALVPQALDAHGTFAYYEPESREIRALGAAPGERVLLALAPGDALSDMALGHDGILYLALGDRVLAFDTRERWQPVAVRPAPGEAPGFDAFRLAADPAGGVWVLDRGARELFRLRGEPLREVIREFDGDVFRPDPENPNPPRLERTHALADDAEPVALAVSSGGDAIALFWGPDASASIAQVFADGRRGPLRRLVGVARPFSIAWQDAATLVVLVATAGGSELVPYAWQEGAGELAPLGGIYPLVRHTNGPFAHALREPARYPSVEPAAPTLPAMPRPAVRLSVPELARSGVARNRRWLDGGRPDFEWHRLYFEAVIAAQCGLRLWLAASERPEPPPDESFALHVAGDVTAPAGTPRAVWSPASSELPHHPGLLPCEPEPHRAGLFGVLIQRVGYRVSTLRGRYLWVRIELAGNGRSSPELFALRAHGSRLSYARRYLPRVYHEQLFAPDADQPSSETTAADFLERMLSNFEGVLTPIEDRIAHAHLLTDPSTAPDSALAWLGQWVGFAFDAAYPPERQREALCHAMELHRWRGTLRGLTRSIDILTDGAVGRGEIVLIEDFRLRRTFSTILGADLADEDDPLLAGISRSGNSFVGDSLILSREFRYEFVAVFQHTLPERPQHFSLDEWVTFVFQNLVDSALVDSFFESLANRLTLLVQRETSLDRVRLLQRILELEAPVHLQTQVVRATHPFIVGLASLVGVDTFLRNPVPSPALRVDESTLGGHAFLRRPPSLDPRLEGGGS